MKTLRILLVLLFAVTAVTATAATTGNDDSCDIAAMPAATLLLPYFEVDPNNPAGETTLVTITNVTNLDTIARVTLWTDRAYPVFTFNVYLTGYDVQALNLFDIIERGIIAPDAGTGTAITKRQKYSDANRELDLAMCNRLPGLVDDATVQRMQRALIEGVSNDCAHVGNEHDHAVGYATIDVVGNCSSNTPTDREYWTRDLRYDNVLTGDYQQVNSSEDSAQGGPLVHIRAMPERGFERTFYARYRPPQAAESDARQPLPAQFAARFIAETSLKVWRETGTGFGATCADYMDQSLAVADVVTFDEQENAASLAMQRIDLPAASLHDAGDERFPRPAGGAENGWMYLNLDRGRGGPASQAWVVTSMRAAGRFSTDVDAVALANGCTPAVPRAQKIEPAGGDDSCDIALLPAATLLLPYFQVDLDDPYGESTLFTITNTSPEERIARVTLWADYSFPVITFNVFLTGYDVQPIRLYDILKDGMIAPPLGTGTAIGERGKRSERNHTLDLSECRVLAGELDDVWVIRMQSAFIEGTVPDFGLQPGCNNIGNEHENAIGYATVDLVRNCSTNTPLDPQYWTEDLAFDNVLIGDYHQVHNANDYAQGSPMVHIRAVPGAGFPRTFYQPYQAQASPQLDRRQPLSSVFAARWINGGGSGYETFLKIWREPRRGVDGGCVSWDDNVATFSELAVFDEAENVAADVGIRSRTAGPNIPGPWEISLTTTSFVSVDDASIFPQLANGAVSGWIYLNLDNDDRTFVNSSASQNWVVTSMRAEGRYSVDMDAAALGNGCSAEVPRSEMTTGIEIVGPRP